MPLPSPQLPDAQDVAALSRYGLPLLQQLAERSEALPEAAGAGLVEALARIALAVQAAEPERLRRQEGWWGRLLGRDIEREAEARALQARLGVLSLRAREQAGVLREAAAERGRAIAAAEDAARALEAWADAGTAWLPGQEPAAQAALAPRVDHLRRLAALRRVEAGQWRLLQAQDDALLQRFSRIHDVLLPAWRQAVLARQAQVQAGVAGQAAMLQARIDDEVAAAQARLR